MIEFICGLVFSLVFFNTDCHQHLLRHLNIVLTSIIEVVVITGSFRLVQLMA